MLRYVLKRIAIAIPVLLIVSFLSFLLLNLAPGDPAQLMLGSIATPHQVQALRHTLGLNEPLLVQFWLFLVHAVQGNLADSFTTNVPVGQEIAQTWPYTIELAAISTGIAFVAGVSIGVLSAIRPGRWLDYLVRVSVLVGFSVPVFVLGLLLVLVFSIKLHWLPPSGAGSAGAYVLPVATLSIWAMATIVRVTRASMLEVLGEEYIYNARARGIPPFRLYFVHALRPALNPVITIVGLQFGQLMAGAVLTEVVFNWPGIGQLLVNSINERDYPTIRGIVLVVAATFILVNLVVDIVHAVVDARVRV